MNNTIRGSILDKAKSLTEGDRNKQYGNPVENMESQELLKAAFQACLPKGKELPKGLQASVDMILVKLARIAKNPSHEDNYVDLAAYAGIAGECAGISAIPDELAYKRNMGDWAQDVDKQFGIGGLDKRARIPFSTLPDSLLQPLPECLRCFEHHTPGRCPAPNPPKASC